MRFEMVSGDERWFVGAPEWALFVSTNRGCNFWEESRSVVEGKKFQSFHSGIANFYDSSSVWENLKIIAERRQITEPQAGSEWNGEGLPPVGVECEMSYSGDEWRKCVLIAHGDEQIIFKQDGCREFSGHRNNYKFRPLRSPQVIARDNAIGELERAWKKVTGNPAVKFEVIYDAIAAGKIPGIKLE